MTTARERHSRMPLVYVAGPYRGATPWAVEQNIRKAEELALRVWEAGAVAVCPHTMTRFYDKALPDESFLGGLIDLMLRCDAVLLLPGHEQSAGTRAEVRAAYAAGMPIFERIWDVHLLVDTFQRQAPAVAPAPAAREG